MSSRSLIVALVLAISPAWAATRKASVVERSLVAMHIAECKYQAVVALPEGTTQKSAAFFDYMGRCMTTKESRNGKPETN